MSGYSSGLSDFTLKYSVSPIILKYGLANLQGGSIPIVFYTSPGSVNGLLQPGVDLDDLIKFDPLPGATIIDQLAATGPTANQQVAANATVTQPLGISLLMTVPATAKLPYGAKLKMLTNIQAKLAEHNSLGGLYTVATPSYIYDNAILLRITDVSGGDTKQRQVQWRWDFSQPLVTISDVQGALNGLMQKLTDQTPPSSTPGGSPGLATGQPTNLVLTGTVPNQLGP
jgi:hypothetical protein